MATDDDTPHVQKTLSAGEVQSLADRLLSRGVSRLFTDQPHVAYDMRLASACLRVFARDMDCVTVDVWDGGPL